MIGVRGLLGLGFTTPASRIPHFNCCNLHPNTIIIVNIIKHLMHACISMQHVS